MRGSKKRELIIISIDFVFNRYHLFRHCIIGGSPPFDSVVAADANSKRHFSPARKKS